MYKVGIAKRVHLKCIRNHKQKLWCKKLYPAASIRIETVNYFFRRFKQRTTDDKHIKVTSVTFTYISKYAIL